MTNHDHSLETDMTPPIILNFVAGVRDDLKPSVLRLLERSTDTREGLLTGLDGYTRRIDAAAHRRHYVDVNLAEAILRSCRHLLESDWPDLDEDQRRLACLACAYYLEADDAEGDLESVFGFDDDALVLNGVLDAIGRPELKVRV